MQDSALCFKDKASPDVVGDCLYAGMGQIVVRVTNLDLPNAQRWIRGFRHSVVQKRCSEDIPVPWLALQF
jgi:hypothetical protein